MAKCYICGSDAVSGGYLLTPLAGTLFRSIQYNFCEEHIADGMEAMLRAEGMIRDREAEPPTAMIQ